MEELSRRGVNAIVAALVLVFAACAAPPDSPPRTPAIDVPERWSAARDIGDRKLQAEWWATFREPRLEALMRQALAGNHDLAAAAARIEQAQAQAKIAGAVLYPGVDAGASVTRARQNFVGSPIVLPGRAGVITSVSTAYGVSLNASWEPDLWGRLRAGVRAAVTDLAATRADFAAAALSLAAQTARVYFAIIESREQLDLAAATLENFRTTTARVRRRYEAGLRPPFDLRLALANQAAAAALVAQRAREVDSAERQLELIIGDYPRATVAVGNELPSLDPLPDIGVPAELLTRRPDVLAAERRIEALGARVTAARAALYPQLRLAGSAGRRANEPAQLFDRAFSVWSLAADLFAPIFEGGRLRAEIELAQARRAEALENYKQIVLGAFTEVESAIAADRLLAEQLEAARERAEQALGAQRLAQDRYSAGLVPFLEVLEAQRQALTAASELLAVRRQRLNTRVDLYVALGGGFGPVSGNAQIDDKPGAP